MKSNAFWRSTRADRCFTLRKVCASVKLKLSIVFVSLLMSIASLSYHISGGFWPVYPIAGAIGAMGIFALILLSIYRSESKTIPYLFLIVLFGTSFRVILFLLPETLIDIDPQAYAVQSQWIIETGSTGPITSSFYGTAALFTTLNSIFAIITDTSPRLAFVITPILVGVIIPTLTFSISSHFSEISDETALIAAVLSAVGLASVRYAVTPRPQTISLVFFMISIFILLRGNQQLSVRWIYLLLLAMIAMIFTHKLPMVIFTSILVVYFCINLLRIKYVSTVKDIIMLVCLSSLVLIFQFVFLTEFISDFVQQSSSLLSVIGVGEIGAGSSDEFTYAVAIAPSITERALRNSNLIFYLVAAICGTVLSYTLLRSKRSDEGLSGLLAATGTLGVLAGLGMLFPVFGFGRILLYAEPFFAIVISMVFSPLIIRTYRQTSVSSGQILTYAYMSIILIVILSQFGAVGIAPDYKDSNRMFLTGGEVAAQSWEADHIEGPVYADPYFADFVSDPKSAIEQRRYYEMATVSQPWHPGVIEHNKLGNATLRQGEYKYYTYRNIEIYRLGGNYQLTWNLHRYLEADYNKVYSNEDVETFVQPNRRAN